MEDSLVSTCIIALMHSDRTTAAVAALVPVYGSAAVLTAIERILSVHRPVRGFQVYLAQNKDQPPVQGLVL